MILQYHHGMSMPYEAMGRTHQKARTRAALVQAARELLSEGISPTVEHAAERAQVSRTTAYRYFPTQQALLVATVPDLDVASLLPDPAPADPAARLAAVVEALARSAVEHEPELRAQLRVSLEPGGAARRDLPLRTGRAIGWIEEALAPLRARVPERDLRRLVLAVRCAVGIEPLVWLTDVAGVSREEAVEVMRSSADALLRSALAEHTSDGE
jgi:AcrR family transcriptional regulator